MPSHPPATEFYKNAKHTELWRTVSREYERFLGPKIETWSDEEERFMAVVNDFLMKLREPRRAVIENR